MIIVRNERQGDRPGVRDVFETAFGSNEVADLVDELCRVAPECAVLVALDGGERVGAAVMTSAFIEGADLAGMVLGPLAVRPEHRRKGIGTALVWHCVHVCTRMGMDFAAVWGAPSFYGRFGFGESDVRIRCSKRDGRHPFLISELRPDAFSGVQGTLRCAEAFSRVAVPTG